MAELLEWIEKDAAARAQLGADEKQNGEKSKRLAACAPRSRRSIDGLAEAKAEVEKARTERDAARKSLRRRETAAARPRACRCGNAISGAASSPSVRRLSPRVARSSADATGKAKTAATALKAAEKAAAEARRGHAAAHAAAGIEAGEACPVCDRKLPAGWKAPAAKDLKKAESALAAAVAAEQASQAQVTKCSVRSEELDRRLNEDRAALESAEKELRAAVAALRELAGKSADPATTGDAPLEPLERKVAAAVKRFEEVERASWRSRRSRCASARESVTRLDAEVKESEKQVAATRGRLELEKKSADRKLAALPEPLRAASLETKPLEDRAQARRQGARGREGEPSAREGARRRRCETSRPP